jgi:integrase
MSITVRPARGSTDGRHWEYSLVIHWPSGRKNRERRNSTDPTRSGTVRFAEQRLRSLLNDGEEAYRGKTSASAVPVKQVPTLAEFEPRVIEWAKIARQKASTISSKETIFKTHLIPVLGTKRLDQIDDLAVQELQATLATKKASTFNNVISVLSKALKLAKKWKVIDKLPCEIERAKVQNLVVKFYDFAEYERLVEGAAKHDHRALLVVLLGAEGGLRMSEIVALRWCDVDFERRQLKIEQATVDGVTDGTKGRKSRIVPMTRRLHAALKKEQHLKGELVLYRDGKDGKPAACKHCTLRSWLLASERRAGLPPEGGLHKLRHSYGSHLAMRGASPKAIQELLGHEDLETTLRYLHLAPHALRGAVDLLENHGAMVEQVVAAEGSTGT